MNKVFFLFTSFLLCFACGKKENAKNIKLDVSKKIIVKTYSYDGFEKAFLSPKTDKIKVINFWATWCKPCVKELPYFEELTNKNHDIEVVLVSLDMTSQKESKLIPFLSKEKLKSKVVHMDEPDANSWIPKISNDWSGAIPATLIIDKNKKKFYEQSFDYKELVEAINAFKNEK